MKIGFIGQGWVGKHYADDFENRGYSVLRYALEEPYVKNEAGIKDCDIVFIAVPTPTTKDGFDDSAVRSAVKLVGKGNTAVIKSTIALGTTESIQKDNPDVFVLHSPEFLAERTATFDAAHPNRNLIGIPIMNETYRLKARAVIDVLPDAPYDRILSARDAELVKYAGNCFLMTKIIYINLLYDLVTQSGGDWESVRSALIHDPRIGISHTQPFDKSGHDTTEGTGGRGAGGHCFIKDFEAFREMYRQFVGDTFGNAVLEAQAEKNIHLLVNSDKDIELLKGVYGDISKFK